MFVSKRFQLTQCPWSSFLSGVHPLFRNYVTCLRLESQVLVTLELPMHPHLATTDCMSAHYISVLSHDVVYLPVLFLAFEPGFRLCLHCNATQARCKCGLSQWSGEACQVHKPKCRREAIGCQLFLAWSPALTESSCDSFSHVSLVVGSLLLVCLASCPRIVQKIWLASGSSFLMKSPPNNNTWCQPPNHHLWFQRLEPRQSEARTAFTTIGMHSFIWQKAGYFAAHHS